MTTPIGSALPLGLPGGSSGFFQIVRPAFDKIEFPGYNLAQSLIDALTAGTAVIKYGTILARDSREPGYGMKICIPNASAWSMSSATDNWKVRATEAVGNEMFPCYSNSTDLSMLSSGTAPIVLAAGYDAQTSVIDPAYTDVNINDIVTAGALGAIKEAVAGTTGEQFALGMVIAIGGKEGAAAAAVTTMSVDGTPGHGSRVITVRFKGNSPLPWVVV